MNFFASKDEFILINHFQEEICHITYEMKEASGTND